MKDSTGKFATFRQKIVNSKISRWVKRKVTPGETMTMIAGKMGIVFAVFGLMFAGAWAADGQVRVKVAHAEIPVQVQTKQEVPPILQKIAKCESKTGNIGKNGQIQYHVNTNGTIDIGKYEVNSIWFKKASDMGYDLTKEADQDTFAIWLFNNYGSAPWESSSKCWK